MSQEKQAENRAEERAVFFDRDGTLIIDEPYNGDPGKVRLYPGVRQGLDELKQAGWRIIIVTNQSGIGRGKITEEQYQAVNAEFVRQCGGEQIIDAVFHAPDHPNQAGPRRKPGIGMFQEAATLLPIDFSRSWTVGDKPSDIAAGRAAGTRTIRVLNEPVTQHKSSSSPADLVVPHITDALKHLLDHS
jgi:D-glycero-D-manno-heptose 1,7-bisphosphate phosphatase